MLTFKLSRRGKKKQPTYRLVVVDKKKDPWGMVKEDVGSYNPHTKKSLGNQPIWNECATLPVYHFADYYSFSSIRD